jgi:hypothetical protein
MALKYLPRAGTPQACREGRHRATRKPASIATDPDRAVCRVCGCKLVRSAATGLWIYSGLLPTLEQFAQD